MTQRPSSQADGPNIPRQRARRTKPTYIRNFRSDVFWWEPDGRVVRVSPGDGIYLMSCMHPDGTDAVFWGGTAGRPRLWLTDGRAIEPLTPADVSARYPAYNLAGDLLVYCRTSDVRETIERIGWRSTAARPESSTRMQLMLRRMADGAERPLTAGDGLDQRPALSPDGSLVVFVSDREGRQGLWTVSTAGGEPQPILVDRRAYRPWWSVDGRRIYFILLGPDRDRIHWIPAGGGAPMPVGSDDEGDTHGPYADPGGDCLLVHSTRKAGVRAPNALWGLFELPFDDGPPRPLRPPGHDRGAHGTRARNGVVTFDVSRSAGGD